MRFTIDSMIFDRLVENDELITLVTRLVDEGRIELVSTHVQRDELDEIPDPEKRERTATIPVSLVPTYGFVIGVSRLGLARLTDDASPYDALAGQSRKHSHDALIAMTAEGEAAVLVSEDRRLRNRATSELGVEAWDWARFRAHLESLSTSSSPGPNRLLATASYWPPVRQTY